MIKTKFSGMSKAIKSKAIALSVPIDRKALISHFTSLVFNKRLLKKEPTRSDVAMMVNNSPNC